MFRNRGGYSLVETMIVLSISGLMLMSVVTIFSAQQRKTQFNQGVRDLESKLLDVINDTSTGYFPAAKDIVCNSAGVDSDPVITDQLGADSSGKNGSCLFMGKAIQIKTDKLEITPIVGNRLAAQTSANVFLPSNPVPVNQLTESVPILWGIEAWAVRSLSASDASGDDYRLVAFVSDGGASFDVTTNSFGGGMQSPSPKYYDQAFWDQTVDIAHVRALKNWTNGVVICLEDSPEGTLMRQSAAIVVGGAGAGATITVQYDSGEGAIKCGN